MMVVKERSISSPTYVLSGLIFLADSLTSISCFRFLLLRFKTELGNFALGRSLELEWHFSENTQKVLLVHHAKTRANNDHYTRIVQKVLSLP